MTQGRFSSGSRWHKLLLASIVLAFAIVSPSRVQAFAICIDTYIGDCLSGSGCDYYDDVTGRFQGGVRVHYQCPV